MSWCKVKCVKCGIEFGGQYREGTEVFCNSCNTWTFVAKEKKDEGKRKKS